MKPCDACAGTANRGYLPKAVEPQSGFSVIELVVVIVVIGLLAVVAVPRFFGNSVFEERAYRDEVSSALRYARNLAVGSGCPVRARIDGNSYELNQQAVLSGHCNMTDTSWPITVRLPDGQAVSGVAPAGVSTAPAFTVVFDAAGRTNLAVDQLITIGTESITLDAGSGYLSP